MTAAGQLNQARMGPDFNTKTSETHNPLMARCQTIFENKRCYTMVNMSVSQLYYMFYCEYNIGSCVFKVICSFYFCGIWVVQQSIFYLGKLKLFYNSTCCMQHYHHFLCICVVVYTLIDILHRRKSSENAHSSCDLFKERCHADQEFDV